MATRLEYSTLVELAGQLNHSVIAAQLVRQQQKDKNKNREHIYVTYARGREKANADSR
jgi:hypothetical protein